MKKQKSFKAPAIIQADNIPTDIIIEQAIARIPQMIMDLKDKRMPKKVSNKYIPLLKELDQVMNYTNYSGGVYVPFGGKYLSEIKKL